MKIIIRNLTIRDLDQVYQTGVLAKEFWVGEDTGFYGKDYLIRWINNKKDDILLVAEKSGQIIGFLFCRVMFRTWAMGENIYVLEKHIKDDIARLLFSQCQKHLKKLNIDYIGWLVQPGSNEEKFIKNFGFVKGSQFFWWEKKTRPLWLDHRNIRKK